MLRVAAERAKQTGWRATVPPHRGIERSPEDMAMYAGLGVGDVTASLPAAEVVEDLLQLL